MFSSSLSLHCELQRPIHIRFRRLIEEWREGDAAGGIGNERVGHDGPLAVARVEPARQVSSVALGLCERGLRTAFLEVQQEQVSFRRCSAVGPARGALGPVGLVGRYLIRAWRQALLPASLEEDECLEVTHLVARRPQEHLPHGALGCILHLTAPDASIPPAGPIDMTSQSAGQDAAIHG